MNPRRTFLLQAGGLFGAGLFTAVLQPRAHARIEPFVARLGQRSADEVARDEDFWFQVQQAFAVDRSLINLNNGGASPAPGVTMEALRRFDEYANHAPARTMWRDLKPGYELVRERLARFFGSDPEEIAITRNTTESLDNVIFGLDLKPGDEILTTDQDYPAMLAALHQRELRDGIVVRKVRVPTPAAAQDDLVEAFRAGVTERTRALLVCHVVFLTGQVFPVRKIAGLTRARGIELIVDGAHSFAHLPFTRDDLDCDYFGTSLHKWLAAPIGTGLLYVRKEKIPGLWPLFGQGEPRSGDIRKYETFGTHPASRRLAIAESLTFHESIGTERKAARLRYLRDRWAGRFVGHPKVRFHANLNDVDSCALTTMGIDGLQAGAVAQCLFRRHRIVVTSIDHEDVKGIRVTPSVYTTIEEIDLFGDALERIIEHGI